MFNHSMVCSLVLLNVSLLCDNKSLRQPLELNKNMKYIKFLKQNSFSESQIGNFCVWQLWLLKCMCILPLMDRNLYNFHYVQTKTIIKIFVLKN